MPLLPRILALLIAIAALLGIFLDTSAVAASSGWPLAIWTVLGYFTILTNLLVAATFLSVAAGRPPSPRWFGGVVLAIALVGVIYAALLAGLRELTGGSIVANFLMHQFTPVAVPLFWLAFAVKGGLRRRDPLLWALYPLAYLGYALARGGVEGRYAYPFIDLGQLGAAAVARNAALIAAGFVLAGWALVWLDRRLAR